MTDPLARVELVPFPFVELAFSVREICLPDVKLAFPAVEFTFRR
jgi:hypothetical protein